MRSFVVLLRGINVGGRNKVTMPDLRRAVEALGYSNVRTYIQSGNLLLDHTCKKTTQIADDIQQALKTTFNIISTVWVISADQLASIIDNNPFPEAITLPKTLHVYLPQNRISDEAFTRAKARTENGEAIVLFRHVLYLHAPDGIGQSKLVQKLDALLDTQTTGRNWKTITQLADRL